MSIYARPNQSNSDEQWPFHLHRINNSPEANPAMPSLGWVKQSTNQNRSNVQKEYWIQMATHNFSNF